MTRINKHPTEEFDASGSIRLVQQAGEAVNLGSSAATATDKDGNDVSTTLLDQTTLRVTSDPDGGANNALTVLVRGGTEAASPYRIEFKVATDLGQIWMVPTEVYVADYE